jgi:hypothetical protein
LGVTGSQTLLNIPTATTGDLFSHTLYFKLILLKHIACFIFHLAEETLNFTGQNADSNWLS